MSILQEMHFESGFLAVGLRGEFSLEEAKRAFLEMLEAVARYKAEKVLLDGRTLTGKPEDLERFFYGEFAAKAAIRLLKDHGIAAEFAYVLSVPIRDPRRLGETVAVNRGMNVKVFEAPEDALKWLTSIRKIEAGDA